MWCTWYLWIFSCAELKISFDFSDSGVFCLNRPVCVWRLDYTFETVSVVEEKWKKRVNKILVKTKKVLMLFGIMKSLFIYWEEFI